MQLQTTEVRAPSAFAYINWGKDSPVRIPPKRRIAPLGCVSAGGGGFTAIITDTTIIAVEDPIVAALEEPEEDQRTKPLNVPEVTPASN